MADRSRDVSDELTEVRTVLSRAETALARLDYCEKRQGETQYRWVVREVDGVRKGDWEEWKYETDPDTVAMKTELAQVVAVLSRWRKFGATASQRHRRWAFGEP